MIRRRWDSLREYLALSRLDQVHQWLGQIEHGRRYYERGLLLSQEINDPWSAEQTRRGPGS